MTTMKNSNVEWVGEIPSNWAVLRVKDGFTQKKAKAHQEDPVVLTLARSGVKIRDMSNAEGQFASSYYDYNPVSIDDMLINPMDLISGDNCSLSKVEGVISPAFRHGFIMHLIYDLKIPREQVMVRSRHRNYASLDAYYNPTTEQIIKMKTEIEDNILRLEEDEDE